jgi:hypothetical protein
MKSPPSCSVQVIEFIPSAVWKVHGRFPVRNCRMNKRHQVHSLIVMALLGELKTPLPGWLSVTKSTIYLFCLPEILLENLRI